MIRLRSVALARVPGRNRDQSKVGDCGRAIEARRVRLPVVIDIIGNTKRKIMKRSTKTITAYNVRVFDHGDGTYTIGSVSRLKYPGTWVRG